MKETLLLLAASVALLSCGKKADPRPPLPHTPQPVAELKVAQRGDQLEMSLAAPRTTTAGERLPVLEIEFLFAPASGDFMKAAEKIVRKAAPGERLSERLPLPTSGSSLRFSARARAGSDVSALAPVISFTVASRIPAPTGLTAQPRASGIALSWTPAPLPTPSPTPSPTPTPTPTPVSPPGPAVTASSAVLPSAPPQPPQSGALVYRRTPGGTYSKPLTQTLLPTGAATHEDASARFGESWCYVVRSVGSAEPLIESPDSDELCLEFKDSFPPAAPTGVAVLLRQGALDVSWSPSPEDDLAAYRVYRRIVGGNPELLGELPATATALLDRAAPRATPLVYTVTAVDTTGNESAHSRPLEARWP